MVVYEVAFRFSFVNIACKISLGVSCSTVILFSYEMLMLYNVVVGSCSPRMMIVQVSLFSMMTALSSKIALHPLLQNVLMDNRDLFWRLGKYLLSKLRAEDLFEGE